MTKLIKNSLSFLMSFVMLVTCIFSANVFAFAGELELSLNTVQTFSVGKGEVQWLAYTPQYSANYTLKSLTPATPPSNVDTFGAIYDTDKTTLLDENDDIDVNNQNYHFSVSAYLEKGKTYYFTAKHSASTVSGQIAVSLTSDKGNEIDYITASIGDFFLEEGRNCQTAIDANGDEYKKYDYTRIISSLYVYVYYADGTYTQSSYAENGNSEINGVNLYYSNNQETSHWTLGGENLFTISYMGATYTLNIPFDSPNPDTHTHSYNEVITTPATANSKGLLTYVCKVCQDEYTKEIEKIGSVSLSTTNYTYDATAKKPSVTVYDENGDVISSSFYDVTYSNNVYSGIGYANVNLKFRYSGTISEQFYINPKKITGLKCSKNTSSSITLTWTKEPNVSGYRIYDSKTGTVVKTVKSNTNSATISGLGAGSVRNYKVCAYKSVNGSNFYGSYSNYYKISTKPSATEIKSLSTKTKSKAITVSWKKKTSATGYIVAYSTSSKFTSKTTKYVTISKNTTTSKKIKGLKAGKKYYVKVLTYKKYTNSSGGTSTVKSSYSKAKSIKCK